MLILLYVIQIQICNFTIIPKTNNILKSCSYLVEDSFNKKCLELRNESDLFSVIHLNARSIPKNFDNFLTFLENVEIQFTAIGVSETWLNETNQNLYGIKGYSQVNNYRPEKRGGRFSLFFNESLEYCRRNDLSFINNSIESICVDISPHPLTQNKCVTLGVIYRPPNTDVRNFLENMSTILANIKDINRSVYIMGDFNFNLINISEHIPTSDFVELMFSYSFFPWSTSLRD